MCNNECNNMSPCCGDPEVEKCEFDCGVDQKVVKHQHVVKYKHDIINEYDVIYEHEYNYYDVITEREVETCNDHTDYQPSYCQQDGCGGNGRRYNRGRRCGM